MCEKCLHVPGATRRWTTVWLLTGQDWSVLLLCWASCLRLAAFSQQVPSCRSFRQREKTATCGLLIHKPEQDARPTPCPLLVESASAGPSHQGCLTCNFLVFYGLFPLPKCFCIPQRRLNHTPTGLPVFRH